MNNALNGGFFVIFAEKSKLEEENVILLCVCVFRTMKNVRKVAWYSNCI